MNTAQAGFIDVHHHVVPPWYREAVTQNYPDLYMPLPTWSVENDGELMERQGMATATLSLSDPGVFFGDQALAIKLARSYSEFVAELIGQFPRLYGAFGVLPLPDTQAATGEAVYVVDTLKLDGIGLLSNYRGFYLSDEGTDELFSELNRRHAVVFLHPAEPPEGPSPRRAVPALFDYPFETTRAITLLLTTGKLEQYPEMRWILAHTGGTLPYRAYPGFQPDKQRKIAAENARALFPRLRFF
jgi:6-methylsalicylate decarboxylase